MQFHFETKVPTNEKSTKNKPTLAPITQAKKIFAKKRGRKWPKLIQKLPWIPGILSLSKAGDPFLSKREEYNQKHLFCAKLSLPRLQSLGLPKRGTLKVNFLDLISSKTVTCAYFSVERQSVLKKRFYGVVLLVFWEAFGPGYSTSQTDPLISLPNNLRSGMQFAVGVYKNISLIQMRRAHIGKIRKSSEDSHKNALPRIISRIAITAG